jgi:long-chain fatty acid transport protein
MRLRTLLVGACLLVLVGTIRNNARADGVVRDGIGPIATGRGATNLGFADNAAMIHDNPAAMANVAGNGLLEGGVDTVICGLHYTDPDNPDVNNIIRGYPAGMIGYVQRVPDSPWTYGIGAFAPAGFGAEYRMTNPFTGPALYRSLGLVGKLLPAVAYQWNDRLSIGASLGLALGHNALEGPFFIQSGPFAGAPTLLDLHVTGAAVAGGVGLQYVLTPQTTVGVAYSAPTRFDMDGNARATVITGLGPLTSGFDAQAQLTWPGSLGVGVKHDLCCCRRIGIDVVWYHWAAAFDEFNLEFSDPTDPVVAALLGPTFRDSFPINWRDTVSLRLGYEWDANDLWTWRTGYIYHDSPAPSSTLNPYLDGVLLHTFSLGFTRHLPRGSVNFAYQYSFSPTREVGASEIVGGDFANSTFTAQSHWINLSYMIPY